MLSATDTMVLCAADTAVLCSAISVAAVSVLHLSSFYCILSPVKLLCGSGAPRDSIVLISMTTRALAKICLGNR